MLINPFLYRKKTDEIGLTDLADDVVALLGSSGTPSLPPLVANDIPSTLNSTTFTGNLNVSTSGSTAASPRIFGLTDFSTDNAARFQFGDSVNSIQNSFGGRTVHQSYWGIEFRGSRQRVTTAGFVTGDQSDDNVSIVNERHDMTALNLQGAPSQSLPLLKLKQVSSTSSVRDVGVIDAKMVVSTDATRTGRLTLSAVDYGAAREGLRIEANGTSAAIGFLGASAATRQTLNAPATDAASTQELVNQIRALVITFGLGE